MTQDGIDIFLQYAVYVLWAGLIIVLLLIINSRYKAYERAKSAKRNPQIHLYAYEYPSAGGAITFFFEADAPIAYSFFILNAQSAEKLIIDSGTCRKGGQKVQFDTTQVENGVYFYGVETNFQKTEKRLEVRN